MARKPVTRYAYDELGRQVRVTDAQGNVTRTQYDKNGNVTATIDPLGNRTKFEFDERDRRVKTFDANNFVNGVLIANPKATVTTYNAVGNILSITDPVGNTTSYLYDGLNRLTTETNQLGLSRTFGYDENGNRVRTVDRNDRTRSFEFDGLNRQIHERWIGVNNTELRDIQSFYDAAGQLKEMRDPDATYAFTYDLLGRLKSVDNNGTLGVARVVLTYDYDRNGNVKTVQDAINGSNAGTTSYDYDWLNRVSQITQSGTGVQNKRVNFAYNSVGQMESLKRYSDLGGTQLVAQTGYSYDSLNRLSQINHRNAAGGSLAFYRFGYDAAGRIQQTVDIDGTTDFTYDSTSQLTGADRAGTVRDESYAYDANGNRSNYTTGADNRLQSDGVYTYTYDNEGNLKTRTRIGTSEVRTFTWDYRNRLIGVSDSTGGATTYTYDGMNRRIAKSVGGTTTRFVYDRDNVLLEFTGNAIPSVRYLHGAEVDQVLAQESASGQTAWMLTDQIGSVRDLVSNAGAVVGHFSYDSFGKIVGATGTTDTRYKFTGRELDQETGLYYYRARYYDAGVGRFIGKDPIGFGAGDANLYRYVGNNSLNATDPSGNIPIPAQPVPGLPPVPPILIPFIVIPSVLLRNDPLTSEKQEYEAICSELFVRCDETRWQDGRGRRRKTPKPCDECVRECYETKGNWPFGKCPYPGKNASVPNPNICSSGLEELPKEFR